MSESNLQNMQQQPTGAQTPQGQQAPQTQQGEEAKPNLNAIDFINVETSSDSMKLYVKLSKPDDGTQLKPTKEDVMKKVADVGVVFGVNEELVDKFVSRPIYNIRIQIGEGIPPTDGRDGFIDYFVVPDEEYLPEISEDEDVDFKNLDYFQMIKKDAMLCSITPPEEGSPGKDLFGRELPAMIGKQAKSPQGKNTSYNDDGSMLFADCDGIINFARGIINVNDILNIRSNVDTSTGNIDFAGDVVIDGDVCEGFSVKSGGNIIVKGVVESANIEAHGDVQIVKGINGDQNTSVVVGGDFRTLYIESCNVTVSGDIIAQSIVDSKVKCYGNIDLSSSGKGMLVGGTVEVNGQLVVKYLGNEHERVTNVKIMGKETEYKKKATKARSEREETLKFIEQYKRERTKYYNPFKDEENPHAAQLKAVDIKITALQAKIEELTKVIEDCKDKWSYEYNGSVVCKGKLYYGTRIYFGEERYQFSLDNLERCKIMWQEGEIINVTL